MRNKQDETVILDAALRVFSRYGYKKSTLEDIASELNMTNTAMYAYAASKRDLYEQTVRYVMKRWQSSVQQAVAKKTTAQEKMAVLCESALYYLAKDVEFCALLRSDPGIFPDVSDRRSLRGDQPRLRAHDRAHTASSGARRASSAPWTRPR